MSSRQIVETIYGKYNKYEITKSPGDVFESTKFYILKDGKPYLGYYSSLRAAVEAAKKEG